MVLDFLRRMFHITLTISLTFMTVLYRPRIKPDSKQTSKAKTKDIGSVITNIECWLALLLLSGAAVAVMSITHTRNILSVLSRIFQSWSIIFSLISYNGPEKLSDREYQAIGIFAYALWLCDFYGWIDSLMNCTAAIGNPVVGDYCYVVLHVLFSFLYMFLTCALALRPLQSAAKTIARLINQLVESMNEWPAIERFVKLIDESFHFNSTLAMMSRTINQRRIIAKVMIYLCSPLILLFDVIVKGVKVFLTVVSALVRYAFMLLKATMTAASKILLWIVNLSGRHAVYIAFRIAIIASVTIAVISNRYEPFFRQCNEGTAVLEFTASAIIIPMLFEWIGAAKQQNKKTYPASRME